MIALLIAGSCNGQTSVTLTFQGLQDQEPVLNYYDGGFGGFGSGPGPNYGITFGTDAIAIVAKSAGGSGNFSGNPSGIPIIVSFLSGPGVIMNVPSGFTTGFSFYYASGPNTGVVTVFDGLNGTGNVLGTFNLAATGSNCDGPSITDYYSCWNPQGVSFSGVAQSVDFSGATNGIGFDNITLGSQTPGSGNPPPTGPILTVTPSVSGSTSTLFPGVLTQTVTVTNSGAAGSFTASIQGAAGFSIQPTSGSIGGAGSTTDLTVSFNTQLVPPGVYTATYTATPMTINPETAGGIETPRNTLPRPKFNSNSGTSTETVYGVLQATTTALNFNLTGSPLPQSQTFTVLEESMHGFSVDFTASYETLESGAIVNLSELTPNVTPGLVTVTAAAGTLPAGNSLAGNVTLTCSPATPCETPLPVVNVYIDAPAPSSITKVLPDFAVGDGFVTDFYVVNSGSSAGNFSINFYDKNGNSAPLPFANGVGNQSRLSGSIPAGGAGFYEAGTPQGSPLTGSAVITSDPSITIQALFRREVGGTFYEAAVPASSGSNEILVPFDATTFSGNGDQIYTGLAIANLDGSNSANVSCSARDSGGNVIAGAIPPQSLPPLGQWSNFSFPPLVGFRGTLDCVSNTQIGAIGIRALGNDAISSLPVIALPISNSSSTKVLPDFAVGAGFVTDFYVVNSGSSAGEFSISFYDKNGSPVPLPFANGVGSQFTISGSIPARGAGFYEAGTPQGSPLTGSAVITSAPSITIQALFRREVGGTFYEAAVPASSGSNEILVPFDATMFSGNGDQIYTGLAIANLDGSNSANVSCSARDSGGNVIAGAIPPQSLPPLGQWSNFSFPALVGFRGTLDCVSNTQIGAIGIRALGNDAISSLPVIVP